MTQPIDRDLMFRVKDVGDALLGRLEQACLDAVAERLIAAADHLGAAAVGARLAHILTEPDQLQAVVTTFSHAPRALDTAALTLGTISVHSALDLCAGAVISVIDRPPAPGGREPGVPQLRKRAAANPLPTHFQRWLDDTVAGDRYRALDELWRDPQAHRPVPRGVFGVAELDGSLRRGSVRVYRPDALNGRTVDDLLGTAEEVLPRLLDFGEERFLALCMAMRQTYAPSWQR